MAALPPTNSTKPSKRSPAAQRQLRPPCKGVAATVAAWLSALVDSGTVLRCSPEDTRSASMPEATRARRRRHDANARVDSSSVASDGSAPHPQLRHKSAAPCSFFPQGEVDATSTSTQTHHRTVPCARDSRRGHSRSIGCPHTFLCCRSPCTDIEWTTPCLANNAFRSRSRRPPICSRHTSGTGTAAAVRCRKVPRAALRLTAASSVAATRFWCALGVGLAGAGHSVPTIRDGRHSMALIARSPTAVPTGVPSAGNTRIPASEAGA
jgi:hypothetical protein